MLKLENIETCLPGVVTEVGDGVVTCKTCIRKVCSNGILDVLNLEIPNIPLMKFGGANAEITFPIKKDDQVLLLAFSRDSDSWKKDYSDDVVPDSCTGLSINDFIAIPFVAENKRNGKAKIRVTDDGDIEFTPASGRKVISSSDFLCRGKVMAIGDVVAGVQEVNEQIIDQLAIKLMTHIHKSAAGPTDPPQPAV